MGRGGCRDHPGASKPQQVRHAILGEGTRFPTWPSHRDATMLTPLHTDNHTRPCLIQRIQRRSQETPASQRPTKPPHEHLHHTRTWVLSPDSQGQSPTGTLGCICTPLSEAVSCRGGRRGTYLGVQVLLWIGTSDGVHSGLVWIRRWRVGRRCVVTLGRWDLVGSPRSVPWQRQEESKLG